MGVSIVFFALLLGNVHASDLPNPLYGFLPGNVAAFLPLIPGTDVAPSLPASPVTKWGIFTKDNCTGIPGYRNYVAPLLNPPGDPFLRDQACHTILPEDERVSYMTFCDNRNNRGPSLVQIVKDRTCLPELSEYEKVGCASEEAVYRANMQISNPNDRHHLFSWCMSLKVDAGGFSSPGPLQCTPESENRMLAWTRIPDGCCKERPFCPVPESKTRGLMDPRNPDFEETPASSPISSDLIGGLSHRTAFSSQAIPGNWIQCCPGTPSRVDRTSFSADLVIKILQTKYQIADWFLRFCRDHAHYLVPANSNRRILPNGHLLVYLRRLQDGLTFTDRYPDLVGSTSTRFNLGDQEYVENINIAHVRGRVIPVTYTNNLLFLNSGEARLPQDNYLTRVINSNSRQQLWLVTDTENGAGGFIVIGIQRNVENYILYVGHVKIHQNDYAAQNPERANNLARAINIARDRGTIFDGVLNLNPQSGHSTTIYDPGYLYSNTGTDWWVGNLQGNSHLETVFSLTVQCYGPHIYIYAQAVSHGIVVKKTIVHESPPHPRTL